MINFIIPLAHDHSLSNNDELRLMLRSLECNYKDDIRIIIIGDKIPEWCHNINFIKSDRPKININYENFYDTLYKLKLISSLNYISDFIYIYDDVILLQNISSDFFNTVPYLSSLDRTPNENKWHNTIHKTEELIGEGYNYETHIPIKLNRLKLKMMFDNFPISYDECPYAPISLYYNIYKPSSISINNCDYLCYDKIEDCIWLNYSDKSFNTLKKELFKLFPNKSKYES